jgi:hypothetical protein
MSKYENFVNESSTILSSSDEKIDLMKILLQICTPRQSV